MSATQVFNTIVLQVSFQSWRDLRGSVCISFLLERFLPLSLTPKFMISFFKCKITLSFPSESVLDVSLLFFTFSSEMDASLS
jgi:hypothetical protein